MPLTPRSMEMMYSAFALLTKTPECGCCSFFESAKPDCSEGFCHLSEDKQTVLPEGHPVNGHDYCKCYVYRSLLSTLSLIDRGIQRITLTDSERASIRNRLFDTLHPKHRIGLREFSQTLADEMKVPFFLVYKEVDEMVRAKQVELYEQNVGAILPKKMLCLIGDLPSQSEIQEAYEQAIQMRKERLHAAVERSRQTRLKMGEIEMKAVTTAIMARFDDEPRIGERDLIQTLAKPLACSRARLAQVIQHLVDDNRLERYQQPVGMPYKKEMLCKPGCKPSAKEKTAILKRLRRESRKRRKLAKQKEKNNECK